MYTETFSLPHCDMTAYVPDLASDPTVRRTSILVIPGGGYTHRSAREGEPIALAFVGMGCNAFVVSYRVAPDVFPAPMEDLACAVAHVRAHAEEYHAAPDQIVLCGFSAGGHAAGLLGVHWHEPHWWQPLGLAPEQVRPDALILSYPVISAGEFAHRGSFLHLTGTEDTAAHQAHSLETLVTPQTPPTFLWHTWTDGSVPVENTLLMAMALHQHGVPSEVHIFPRGGHGAALANEVTRTPGEDARKLIAEAQVWPEMSMRFLRQRWAARNESAE